MNCEASIVREFLVMQAVKNIKQCVLGGGTTFCTILTALLRASFLFGFAQHDNDTCTQHRYFPAAEIDV